MALPLGSLGGSLFDLHLGVDEKILRSLLVFAFLAIAHVDLDAERLHTEGARLLRGQPGSKITLTIIRGNAADPHEVTLVREKSLAPFVTSKMLAAIIPVIGSFKPSALINNTAITNALEIGF